LGKKKLITGGGKRTKLTSNIEFRYVTSKKTRRNVTKKERAAKLVETDDKAKKHPTSG